MYKRQGIHNAVETYSDFNVAVHLSYYDPYDYHYCLLYTSSKKYR